MHILVVEDDQFLQKVYVRRLQEAGHTVIVCGSGEAALESVKVSTPDLILLDLILPGKDGFVILKTFKEMPETQDVPVVMLTNINQKVDHDRGLQLGAAAYISKSEVEEGSLAAVVEKFQK